ncbi:MAG TPA: hypothetical protein VNT79_17165 [Phycisphaerae bacterium]|nr:hypothetical protein [Phycisphaerae bacterium]
MTRNGSNCRYRITICLAAVFATAGADCEQGPSNTNGNNNSNSNGNNNSNNNSSTSGGVVVTDFGVQKEGMVAVGDGIIAFASTGRGLEVSWMEPGADSATAIDGDLREGAVYCAGKKVIGVQADTINAVVVHDTTNGTSTVVPETDVWDIAPGANLENNDVAVDGHLVAILHRGDLGKELKLIDVSGDDPVVTAFTFGLTNAVSVDVNADEGQIMVMEDNDFITVFPADGAADVTPFRYDVATDAGIPIAYSPKPQIGGGIVIFQELNADNAWVLNLTTGVSTQLSENPASNNGSTNLEARAGFFAYFLNRDPSDNDSAQGSRLAIGAAGDLDNIVFDDGADIGDGAMRGFGFSVAITPGGTATFLAGRFGGSSGGGNNQPSFLQWTDSESMELLRDTNGNSVIAADVVCTDALAAFKVPGDGNVSTALGYFVP